MPNKPLNELNKKTRSGRVPAEPACQAGSIVPHSGQALARSNTYHKNLGNLHTRAVDNLNPTTVVPAHRSYPGMPN